MGMKLASQESQASLSCDLEQATCSALNEFIRSEDLTEISSTLLFPGLHLASLLNYLGFIFLFFKITMKTLFTLYSQGLHEMLIKTCPDRDCGP